MMPVEWTQYEIVLFGKGWGSWAEGLEEKGILRLHFSEKKMIPLTYIYEADYLAEMTETGTVTIHKNRRDLCVNDFLHMLYKRVPNTVVVEPSGYEDPTLADLAEAWEESPARFVMVHQRSKPGSVNDIASRISCSADKAQALGVDKEICDQFRRFANELLVDPERTPGDAGLKFEAVATVRTTEDPMDRVYRILTEMAGERNCRFLLLEIEGGPDEFGRERKEGARISPENMERLAEALPGWRIIGPGCEHLNTLDPMGIPDPEVRVNWCRDCGALILPSGTIILPGAE